MIERHDCDTDEMQVMEIINPAARLSDETLATMDKHREHLFQANRERQTFYEQSRPSRDESLLKGRIQQQLTAQANLEDEVAALAQFRSDRIEALNTKQLLRNDFLFPNFPPLEKAPIAGQSQFWWARTSINYPSRLGMVVYFE